MRLVPGTSDSMRSRRHSVPFASIRFEWQSLPEEREGCGESCIVRATRETKSRICKFYVVRCVEDWIVRYRRLAMLVDLLLVRRRVRNLMRGARLIFGIWSSRGSRLSRSSVIRIKNIDWIALLQYV